MTSRPTFQPQNPAINGYYLGWQSCTCYSGAMAAAFDSQVGMVMTGGAVRNKTGDRSGGTTLAQVDSALNDGWHKDLSLHYGLPWSQFAKMINSGMAGVLQLWYAPIADMHNGKFDAGNGFRGNHAVLVLPGWIVMDPLADGRFSNGQRAYKYHGEAYPQDMLMRAAGQLNIAGAGYRPLGSGLVYAGMTRDRVHDYSAKFTGGAFWVYALGTDGKIAGRKSHSFSGPTSARCTPPRWVPGNSASKPPGGYTDVNGGRSMVLMTNGALKGQWVAVPQSTVHVEVVP